jgi:hypothetical protein
VTAGSTPKEGHSVLNKGKDLQMLALPGFNRK